MVDLEIVQLQIMLKLVSLHLETQAIMKLHVKANVAATSQVEGNGTNWSVRNQVSVFGFFIIGKLLHY